VRDINHEADFSVSLRDNVRKTLRYNWEFKHRERRRKGCIELCGQAVMVRAKQQRNFISVKKQ
jgi:hypothetical protein